MSDQPEHPLGPGHDDVCRSLGAILRGVFRRGFLEADGIHDLLTVAGKRSRTMGQPRLASAESCLKCSGETSAKVLAAADFHRQGFWESSGQASVQT